MTLRSIPIRASGNRSNLLLGGDRELVLLCGTFCVTLLFTAITAPSIVIGLVGMLLWTVGLYLLRLMAKADPWMRHVYMASLKFRRYYAARSTPFCVDNGQDRRLKNG